MKKLALVLALGRGVIVLLATVAFSLAPSGEIISLRYNDVQWKASHNSYAQPQDILFQLREWNLRSIEFDLHVQKKKWGKTEVAPPGDFLVFHTPNDDFSNCRLLSDCLSQVQTFHQAFPRHEIITIFFDMEGVGAPGHTREDLYALFQRALPEGSIFTPGHLLERCPQAKTLQEAVTADGCSWPLLSELEGKFILVVSDGREAFLQAGYDVKKDLVFLVAKNPKAADMKKDPNLVFFNMSGPNPLAREVKKARFISRCYWLNQEANYLKAKENGAHHLATDKIDPSLYPWSVTSEGPGIPYRIIR